MTVDDIKSFEEKYKGSEEEAEDLKRAYLQHKGDMDHIMNEVCGRLLMFRFLRRLLAEGFHTIVTIIVCVRFYVAVWKMNHTTMVYCKGGLRMEFCPTFLASLERTRRRNGKEKRCTSERQRKLRR